MEMKFLRKNGKLILGIVQGRTAQIMEILSKTKKINIARTIAVFICTCCFLFLGKTVLDKLLFFGYSDWDLALFTQNMWNLKHGEYYGSLFGTHFFGNHASFFAYVVFPIFYFFSHPQTLLILQILSFVVSGYILYLIGEDFLDWKSALLIMLIYFVYPPNVFGQLFEFHFEGLAPAFLMLSFYFFYKNRYWPFLITCCAFMSMKENLPLVFMGYGLVGLLSKPGERLKWGVIPIAVGALYLYLCVNILIPKFASQESFGYFSLYSHLEGGTEAAVQSSGLSIARVIEVLFSPINMDFINRLFRDFIYLPLLSPWPLLICGGIFLQHLLSNNILEHTIYYHYILSISPFLFIGFILTLKRIRENCCSIVFYALIAVVFLSNVNSLFNREAAALTKMTKKETGQNLYYRRIFLKKSSPKDGVIASFEFLPKLATRKHLYAFYKVYGPSNPEGYDPEGAKMAIIDFDNDWIRSESFIDPYIVGRRLKKFFHLDNRWHLEGAAGHLVFLEKRMGEKKKTLKKDLGFLAGLVRIQDKAYGSKVPAFSIGKELDFFEFEVGKPLEEQKGVLPLRFKWKAQNKMQSIYSFSLCFKINGKWVSVSSRHVIGYAIHPTILWEAGTVVDENFYLILPDVFPGDYAVRMSIFRHTPQSRASGRNGSWPSQNYMRGDLIGQHVIGRVRLDG